MFEVISQIPIGQLSTATVCLGALTIVWRYHTKNTKELLDRVEAIRKESHHTLQETQTYWEERYDKQAEQSRSELERERRFYQSLISKELITNENEK